MEDKHAYDLSDLLTDYFLIKLHCTKTFNVGITLLCNPMVFFSFAFNPRENVHSKQAIGDPRHETAR